MITEPQVPTDELRRNWYFEVAEQEIAGTLPPQLKDNTMIRLDDVRSLMIAAWLRGRTWEAEQQRNASSGESHGPSE